MSTLYGALKCSNLYISPREFQNAKTSKRKNEKAQKREKNVKEKKRQNAKTKKCQKENTPKWENAETRSQRFAKPWRTLTPRP